MSVEGGEHLPPCTRYAATAVTRTPHVQTTERNVLPVKRTRKETVIDRGSNLLLQVGRDRLMIVLPRGQLALRLLSHLHQRVCELTPPSLHNAVHFDCGQARQTTMTVCTSSVACLRCNRACSWLMVVRASCRWRSRCFTLLSTSHRCDQLRHTVCMAACHMHTIQPRHQSTA